MNKIFEYINRLYFFIPEANSAINLKQLIVSIIVIVVAFSILLSLKESFGFKLFPVFVDLFGVIIVFVGRSIRIFQPAIGTTIQGIATEIITWCVIATVVFYCFYLPGVIFKCMGLCALGALVFQIMGITIVRDVLLLIFVVCIVIKMIVMFIKR